MQLFLDFLSAVFVAAVLFALIIELAQKSVLGKFIKEKDLDVYLSKYLPYAKINPYSKKGTMLGEMPKYVALFPSVLTKWHIEDYGTIPRWSKWSKRLDEKREFLLKQEPIKSLSDY